MGARVLSGERALRAGALSSDAFTGHPRENVPTLRACARPPSWPSCSQPFLGREFSAEPDYSDEVAREIDDEIRRIVEEAHQTSKDILTERREQLDTISKILLERETIEAEQFVALLEGKPEEEVFPPEEEETAEPSEAEAEKGTARQGPRPRVQPKPGLAGGGAAEMRGDGSR